MADFDSKLPVRTTADSFTTEIADSLGTTINPAKEDGNLASIKTNTDKLDTNLSTRLADSTFTARINTLGQKTSANSTPVVLASDQSSIPVSFSTPAGTNPDFKKATAITAGSSDTHSFTPGTTINLTKISASASGQTKVEVQWGTTGAETSKWVGFTSKGNLTTGIHFPNAISITSSQTIKVIVTNLDNQTMDLYSSIIYY